MGVLGWLALIQSFSLIGQLAVAVAWGAVLHARRSTNAYRAATTSINFLGDGVQLVVPLVAVSNPLGPSNAS